MSNLNRISIQGNLVDDPELVGKEQNVARFTVACNIGFGDNEDTAFIPCVAFGKQAGVIAKHFQKGRQIIVNGSLVQNRWEDKETGGKRSRLEIRLATFEGFHFVGGQRPTEASEDAPARAEEEAAPAATSEAGELF